MIFQARTIGLVSLALGCSCALFGQPKKPDGFVNDMAGRCWLQSGSSMRPTAKGDPLKAGDKVRCDKPGRLTLQLQGRMTTIDPSDSWTTIPSVTAPSTYAMAGPVDDWFKLAAAPRAGSLAWVYSPPGATPGSAVWPATFVIRWIPQSATGNISLSVRDESGTALWPPGKDRFVTVTASVGELVAADLREALLAYRVTGRLGPLTLVLLNPEGDESEVKFSVISAAQEDSLRRQLMVCDEEDGLMRYICRAYEFRQLRLYTEAADVYESALRDFAPDSVGLMEHAIAAHQLTGNYQREEILTHQLPPGTKTPE